MYDATCEVDSDLRCKKSGGISGVDGGGEKSKTTGKQVVFFAYILLYIAKKRMH